MSKILALYTQEPSFPATDQASEAQRYKVGDFICDTIEGEPTLDDIHRFMQSDVADRIKAFEHDQDQISLNAHLRNASPQDIEQWIDETVQDVAGARYILKMMLKYLVARRFF